MEKLKKSQILKKGFLLKVSIGVVIFLLISLGVIYASTFAAKGELNDDGEIDYADVELLELHLNHTQALPEEKLSNADMNNDNQITVTDLTLLIQKIEKTLDYEVQLSDVEQENYYPEKNEEITLKFAGEVSYGADIQKVVINGQEYDVQKTQESDTEYSFKVNVGNEAGIKEYHFTEVILENEKRIKVDYTIKIDVLKQKPTVENYVIEQDIDAIKMKLSFDIVDEDNCLVDAVLEVQNENDEIIQTETLQRGRNNIDVPMENGKTYKANLMISYELDSDQLPQEIPHSIREYIVKELQIVVDYDFQISNIETKNQGNQTTTFEKGQSIELNFESSNTTKFEPITVKVNGKEYTVTKQDGKYLAMIDAISELGENELVIEEVTLENGKKFTLENDNKVSVNIIKAKPTVTELETVENVEENNIKVSFNLKDEDRTIKEASVILLDAEGNEIQRQLFTETELQNTGAIQKTLATSITSKYMVKVIATYNQTGVETEDIVNATLLEQEVKAKPIANIVEASCNKVYAEKGEDLIVTYKIDTNKVEEISKIRVNNTDSAVTKLENGRYQVLVKASTTSGIQELEATKIIYSDEETANVSKKVQVEVLKDKPTSEAFKQVDDIENTSITLTANIIDLDQAFISGKAELRRDSDNALIATKEFDAEHITFTISKEDGLEANVKYTMYAYMTYDRDTNRIDSEPQQENYRDNYVENEQFRERPIQLIEDYKAEIANIKTYNGEKETRYFERGEKVTVSFECQNTSDFYPTYAVVNGTKYELQRIENSNRYKTTPIEVVSDFGPKTITIEKLILNNTVEIAMTENNQTSIGILKLRPTVTDFSYADSEDGNSVNVKFVVNDPEETITGGKIIILNENGKQIKEAAFNRNSNGITFAKGASEGYVIKVLANYDLDTNQVTQGENEYTNQELLSEEIGIDRLIEFKDISSFELYRQNNNSVEELDEVKISELNDLTKYVVKVNMKNERSFYAAIKEYKIQDNNLRFVLDCNQIVQYEGSENKNQLEVEFGNVEEDIVEKNDIQTLIKKIKENPSGTFNLYRDYDIAEITTTGTTLIDLGDTAFTGTINGNGHTIYNLNKPLFKTLDGATVQNLILQDVTLAAATSNGTIANTATNANIKNVHIKNLSLTTKTNATAGFIGTATGGTIEECSLTKLNISTSGHIRVAGFVGYMSGGTIKNSYVEGSITSKQSKDGNGIGSILGHATGSTPITIENCIAKVEYVWTGGGPRLNGGILGLSQSSNTILKNNVSLATGTVIYKVYGSNIGKTSTNNYELEESTLVSNSSGEIVKTVSQNNVTSEFFKNDASFDENIWNLSDVSYDNLPTLKNDDPNQNGEEEQASVYIPDYARVSKLSYYQKDREIIYHNMYELMPFYDARYYIKDGNTLPADHILNTKIIKSVLPYDENGKLVLALSKEQKDKIKTIKILFTDNETVSYSVKFKRVQEQIVHYKIEELGIDYTFDKYLVNTQSATYKYIVEQIKAFNYAEELATLVEGSEVRTTSENYEIVKADAENFAMKLLANNDVYSITIANSVVDNKVKQELTTDKMLEKLAYVYNYYNRYYNIEIGGINMSDLVYFDFSIFNDNFNSVDVTNTYVNTTTAYRSAGNIVGYYNAYIKPSTTLSYMDFLEFFIKNLAEDKYKEDPASWIIDNFKGPIYEESAPRYPEIRYRVWDHLKALNSNMIPLILSYQGDEIYLLGVPTTILTGNIELYTPKTRDERIQLLVNFAHYAVPFYDSIAGVVEETRGYTNMLNMTKISYDSTYVKNWSQEENIAPAFKAFNEPLGLWITAPASAAAVANGSDMRWLHSHALTSFVIYSHEAVHNQDGSVFLEGTGRRAGAGGEHFTDNFLTQGNNAYGVVPNYSLTRTITTQTTTNISKDRIDTREKIESYYKGMYDTFAYLDYIEAQAFLQLTPAEQCKIALVVDENTGAWGYKAEEDFEKMNLKTIEDLWDNHLIIIRGNKAYTTGSWWYVYANKNVGAAGKAQFVLNAYQFLADFGYDGYVAYAGNKYGSKTDEQILQILTGDDTMTFKKYQLSRYENVEQKLNQVECIDVEEAIRITLEAMKLDVEYNRPIDINNYASIYRETLYAYLKRVTNDFETSIYEASPNVVHITTAEEFIEKVKDHPEVNIVLDADIDFSECRVEITDDYYISTFVGTLDGNGHTIKGLARPLFSNMLFAKVTNLSLADSEVTSLVATAGTLARAMDFSILENITIKNVSITGLSTIGGLVGNINRTTVTNITYNGVNVSNTNNAYNEVGGLFGKATYSYIGNVHGVNSTVSGNGYVGGIAGNVNMMHKIKESSFNGTVTAKGNYVGGLIGYLQNSTIENSYSLGKVTGKSFTGGLVGTVYSSILDKTYSNATVTGTTAAGTGGLIGNVLNATNGRTSSSIKDSIALGRVINGYKFDAYSTKAIIEASFTNNYELTDTMGTSTLNRSGIEFDNRITAINLADLNNEFYTNTLNWDTNIWDFTNVPAGGIPKLKGLDTNNVTTIIVKTEIATVEDFLKINEAPSEIYTLTNDLDFENYTTENSTIITANFVGKLEGNGHTIYNLNKPLFKTLNGAIIQDLILQDVTLAAATSNGTIANTATNASIKNVHIKNLNLTTKANATAGFIGTVTGGTIEECSLTKLNISTSGHIRVAGFVGYMSGGTIKNSYVEGSITSKQSSEGNGIGSILGHATGSTPITIENCIAKVEYVWTGGGPRLNGGILGLSQSANTILKNNVSLATGTVIYKVYGSSIDETSTNNYELEESTLVSNSSGEIVKTVSQDNVTGEFFKNDASFDENIWNLSGASYNNLPTLKNDDPNK